VFDWDDANLRHVARHRLSAADVEQALMDPRRIDRIVQPVAGETRAVAIGATAAGRILVVVTTTRDGNVRVVTAYPAAGRERRLYGGGR
jgi:uncharacterized DUF497 family protein